MSEPWTLTSQGRRTRAAIMSGARKAFSERGFHRTRISDIAVASDISVGTLYRYFEDKHALLQHVIIEIGDEVYGDLSTPASPDDSPRITISEANLLYLRSFQRHVDFWKLLGEAAFTVPEAKRALADRRHYHQGRALRLINRWQAAGVVDISVEIDAAAAMLCAMTERCAYIWYVFGEAPDTEESAAQLTTLWMNALGISA